jgi:predicted amidophosphoribosyltransferase
MLDVLRSLVFPRACIGCDRDDVLLCEACAGGVGPPETIVRDGLVMHACLPYAGNLRAAIASFKRGRRAFAPDLAALLVPSVDASMTLVPIPTTRSRRAERGFDQTVLLAHILRRQCGLRVAQLLESHGKAAQQGRSRSERLAATGRFRVRRREDASGATLILFDDVRTTGATLVDAARTLAGAGFDVTCALTLAWAPKEK